MRNATLASIGLLLAACGGGAGAGPCEAPDGCVRAGRVNGACACLEWATVSTETVRLPFVVVEVAYLPVGSASAWAYGVSLDDSTTPQAASSHGANVRAVIRSPGGAETVARVGSLSEWADLTPMSETTLRVGGSETLLTYFGGPDLPDAASDALTVWTNASVTVVTDAGGGKRVDWSPAPPCFGPFQCDLEVLKGVTVRALRGATTGDPYLASFLASLGEDGRAALLALDVRAATGVADLPRYASVLLDVPVDGTPREVPVTWTPCVDPDRFDVLAETAVPLAGGDTFVLQYGVQHDATCSAQWPGLLLGSATPGCAFEAAFLVDRVFGTLVAGPYGASPSCTGG